MQNSTIVRFCLPTERHPAENVHRRPPALHKGQQTRAAILEAALGLASQMGLEGLSIGALAEVTRMSKSGVFAHFGSREELQISVIREYHAKFDEEVFEPAIREPRGLPRLAALFERWVRRVSVEIDSGCIYISGAVEFDDRPGPVRDALAEMVRAWHAALERAIRIAIEESHLAADTDPKQLLFEVHGLDPGAAPRRAFPAHSRRARSCAPRLQAHGAPVRDAGRARVDSNRRRRAGRAAEQHSSNGVPHDAPVHPAAARHAVRDARSARRALGD